ncbi:hypothetical protein Sjap_009250 [Stephania japonica]|uniref:Uncharacterized protein n=1 Tax=Stephania japonica TaxID=461633 RepID=A0AAP0PF93_9MAGN
MNRNSNKAYEVSSLSVVLLARIATVCSHSAPGNASLSTILSEIFEVIHFVERKMNSSTSFKFAKAAFEGPSSRDELLKVFKISDTQVSQLNNDIVLERLKDALPADLVQEELHIITDFIKHQNCRSIQELDNFITQLFVEILNEFLKQLPNAIYKEITESSLEDYEKVTRLSLKLLHKVESLEAYVPGSYPIGTTIDTLITNGSNGAVEIQFWGFFCFRGESAQDGRRRKRFHHIVILGFMIALLVIFWFYAFDINEEKQSALDYMKWDFANGKKRMLPTFCSCLLYASLASANLRFCETNSDYKWSMTIIVVSQTITIAVGTFANTFRIATASISFPLSESLLKSLNEVFEIIHFVDTKVNPSNPMNKMRSRLAKAMWAGHDFSVLLPKSFETSTENEASNSESQVKLAVRITKWLKYALPPTAKVASKELAIITDFIIEHRDYSSIEDL